MKEKLLGFKPCYKWNTFNTLGIKAFLIWPKGCFKPCYKWNTFNTVRNKWIDRDLFEF